MRKHKIMSDALCRWLGLNPNLNTLEIKCSCGRFHKVIS